MLCLDLTVQTVEVKAHSNEDIGFEQSKRAIQHLVDETMARVSLDRLLRAIFSIKLFNDSQLSGTVNIDALTIFHEISY